MTNEPSKTQAGCRAVALSLLSLGALLAAIVPHAEATCIPQASLCVTLACDPTQPLTCCDPLGINCNINCTQPLDPVCCLAQNPTQPQLCPVKPPCDLKQPLTCCPPQLLSCRCPPTTVDLCCLLNGPITHSCVDCRQFAPPEVCCATAAQDPSACFCVQPNPDGDCVCGNRPGDPRDLCDTSPCLADGLLVTEQDFLGGTSRNAYAESRINSITPAVGAYTPPPGPAPSPPLTSMVHADAQLAGAHYANGALGLDVSASTVFSRCDMNAVNTPAGLFADTYARGGVQDLHVTVLGQDLDFTALELEMQAFRTPGLVTAAWACDLAEVGLNNPPPTAVAALCGAPISVTTGFVNVYYNEIRPPTFDPVSGYTYYQGSHLHVQVNVGAALVDIYVGYVQVAVPGGPAPALPATYLPHGPCLVTPLCS
ncbi:MAG: hypothetical protein QOG31_709 [Thermoplasmata archaeon]|jgi:hypothetical protein|nr:hypothetical protein [Thermoplasmata archaeon]